MDRSSKQPNLQLYTKRLGIRPHKVYIEIIVVRLMRTILIVIKKINTIDNILYLYFQLQYLQ